MPSPVGHSLLAHIIYGATARPVGDHSWQLMLVYLLAANAPDLDLVPGFMVGDPNRYHHGISHSIGSAVLFASAVSLSLSVLGRGRLGKTFAISFGLYLSHLVLDYMNLDTTAPYGEPIFWPLSDEYHISPFALLPDIQRASGSGVEFLTSLASLHNLGAVAAEILLLSPLALLVALLRRRANPKHKGADPEIKGRDRA